MGQVDHAAAMHEAQLWLQHVWQADPDVMCTRLAGAALATLSAKTAES